MTCDLTPQPADYELLAHLDGEAEPRIAAHVEQCQHCRARAADLAREQARLAASLHRITCPEAQELGEFHLGLLPRERRAAMRDHLVECHRCRGELAQLEVYLGELAADVAPSPAERVRMLVARLVRPPAERQEAGALAPAYAGIRGSGEGPSLYQVEGVQIALEVQRDAARPDRLVLLGLLTGAGTGPLGASLELGGASIAQAEVDAIGNVTFSGLPPAVYDLVLRGPDLEIRIPQIAIGRYPAGSPPEDNP